MAQGKTTRYSQIVANGLFGQDLESRIGALETRKSEEEFCGWTNGSNHEV
jgi:hypothetical protein